MASLLLARSMLRSSPLKPAVPRRPQSGVHAATCVLSRPPPTRSLVREELLSIKGGNDDRRRSRTETMPVVEEDGMAMIVSKLYAVVEAAEDRVDVHATIGEQRNNWNVLLLNSINSIALAASISAGLATMAADGGSTAGLAFRVSSTVLYIAATALMSVVNYIQPSQLAEEQRHATRLYKQVVRRVQTILAVGNPSQSDVDDATEMILSIDSAYPLALLDDMINKFPDTVEPAVWWPTKRRRHRRSHKREANAAGGNGWDEGKKLERVMTGFVKELREKHTPEYLTLGNIALTTNRILAITGPVLTGIAAVASASNFGGGTVAGVVGVVGGALATVVNSLQHGGQVGMVFEMYRNCAGFYREIEEEIVSNLEESDVGRRENGELLEFKVALKLSQELSPTSMD